MPSIAVVTIGLAVIMLVLSFVYSWMWMHPFSKTHLTAISLVGGFIGGLLLIGQLFTLTVRNARKSAEATTHVISAMLWIAIGTLLFAWIGDSRRLGHSRFLTSLVSYGLTGVALWTAYRIPKVQMYVESTGFRVVVGLALLVAALFASLCLALNPRYAENPSSQLPSRNEANKPLTPIGPSPISFSQLGQPHSSRLPRLNTSEHSDPIRPPFTR